MIYAVTGATGHLGALAVQQLLKRGVPASSVVALARDANKTSGLKALGVTVRIANYDDAASWGSALAGVDRLLLISGSDVGGRDRQHGVVINAAKAAGVKLIAYTSIAHADTSTNPLAPEHKATEALLKSSGVPFVLLRHNWYTENYTDDLKFARESGMIANAAGQGRVASATRAELAEADVHALMSDGQEGKIYELNGPAWSFEDFARAASEVLGRPVTYQPLTPEARRSALVAVGLPEGVADFVVSLDLAIAAGTLAHTSNDLETLLGRKPLSLVQGLRTLL